MFERKSYRAKIRNLEAALELAQLKAQALEQAARIAELEAAAAPPPPGDRWWEDGRWHYPA